MLKYLLLFFTASLLCKNSAATDEPALIAPLEGRLGQLRADSSALVQDAAFYEDLQYNAKKYVNTQTKNIITFSLDEGSSLFLKAPFKATIVYRLYFSFKTTPATEDSLMENQTLEITYDTAKTNTYKARNSFVFEDAVSVRVKIVSISTTASGWDPIPALKLTNEMRISRTYVFDCDANKVQQINFTQPDANADELNVSWLPSKGADEYDLEWAYVDASALNAGIYGTPGTDVFQKNIFRNNASRVTVNNTTHQYKIPLLYESDGKLFFRVRAVQLTPEGKRTESNWSVDNSFDYSAGHQSNLNWQSSTSFAEEGKRKSVVQYFDGSLRNRQTVTKDNSTHTTVVAETMYDYQGRPVIQVLPAPTLNTIIKYSPGFNNFLNSSAYYKDNYDTILPGNDYCNSAAPELDTSKGGAAEYYSPANPEKDAGFNKLIPDAKGFPYTETKFLQDNTGRIAAQSGVGSDHRLNSGHETKYYYGNPDQAELDALFGTEAGDASHYFKNMVRDANGQYSVSYIDMHGRTIATALAGDLPASAKLDYLPSRQDRYLTKELTNASNNIIKGLVIESSKGLLVSKTGDHEFIYSLLPENVNIKNCRNEDICYSCSYTLEITISDDCGNKQFGGQPYVYKDVVGNINTNCTNLPALFTRNFNKVLEEGSYTITKKLTIRDEAIQQYQQIFAEANLCKTVQDFVQEQKHIFLQRTNNCAAPCITCRAQLGASEEEFINKFIVDNGLDATADRPLAVDAYNKLIEQCDEWCEVSKPQNYIDQLRTLMIQDVTPPYGQYARSNEFEIEGDTKVYDALGIFGRLSQQSTMLKYMMPLIAYKNEDGSPASVMVYRDGTMMSLRPQQLTVEEFVSHFQPSWAEALVDNLHPELAKYNILARTPSAFNTVGVGRESYDWDQDFILTETFEEALRKGYLNPTNYSSATNRHPRQFLPNLSNTDPFFQQNAGQRFLMQQYMDKVSSDGSTNLDMWTAASMASFCSDQNDMACLNAQIADPFSTSGCTADLDMAWRSFRALYKAKKDALILEMVKANTIPNPLLDPEKYHSYFVDIQTAVASGTGIDDIADKSEVDAALQNFYSDGSTCNGYLQLWWNKLTPCDTIKLLPYKEQLLADLVQVCVKGTDEKHFMGASSIAPDSTNTYKNFDEVLAHYIQLYHADNPGNTIAVSDCNGSLLNFPSSYNTPQIIADKPIVTKPEDCECEKVDSLYTAFQQEGKDADFSAYILRTTQTAINNSTLDSLRGMCNGTIDCRFIPQPIYLPSALQCGMDNVCVACEAVSQGYADYKALYPDLLPSVEESSPERRKANLLFAHYMNAGFGFSKQAQEYLVFMDSCGKEDAAIVRDSLWVIKERFNRDASPLRVRAILQTNSLNPTIYSDDISQSVSNGMLLWPQAIRDTAIGYFQYFQHVISGSRYCFENGYAIEFRFKFLKEDIRPGEEFFYYSDGNGEFVLYRRKNGPIERQGVFVQRVRGRDSETGQMINLNTDYTLISHDPDLIFKEWTTMKFEISQLNFRVYANNILIKEVPRTSTPLINKGGFTLSFMHFQAALDWTKIYDHTGRQVFFDDYLSNTTRQTIDPSFLCPQPTVSCEDAFVKYYNQQKGTSYRFSQIDSLYRVQGLTLDACPVDIANVNCDQLDHYLSEYKDNYLQPASGYVDLDMRTFAGNKTPDEGPKGVFNVKGKLLGNTIDSNPTAIKESYINIWNGSEDNNEIGTLSLMPNGQFRLTLKPGQTAPVQGIIGQRYYQFEVHTNDTLNSFLTTLGSYIDFGDSTTVYIGDSLRTAHTIVMKDDTTQAFFGTKEYWGEGYVATTRCYVSHFYPQTVIPVTYTTTVYHTDYKGVVGFYDYFKFPRPSQFSGIRGYFPKQLIDIEFNGTKDSTINSTKLIRNFNQISSLQNVEFDSQDANTPFLHNNFSGFEKNRDLRRLVFNTSVNPSPGYDTLLGKHLYESFPDININFPKLRFLFFQSLGARSGDISGFNFELPELIHFSTTWQNFYPAGLIDSFYNQLVRVNKVHDGLVRYGYPSSSFYLPSSASKPARDSLISRNWHLLDGISRDWGTTPPLGDVINTDSLIMFSSFSDFINSKLGSNYSTIQIDSLWVANCGHKPDFATTPPMVNYPSGLLLCGKTVPTEIPIEPRNSSPCADSLEFVISRGFERYTAYSDSVKGEFTQTFINKCLEVVAHESLTVRQSVSEYHYTLYYYDQAGNLVKTVPPMGVHPNYDSTWRQQVKIARENKTVVVPDHNMVTQYRYNTLNQVVQQKTPDAGKSRFWYDRLGRLVLSQNAQQAANGADGPGVRYSYTLYDHLSRITEVGQINNASPAMTNAISRQPDQWQDWLNSNITRRQQVTLTVYDQSAKESFLHKDLSPYIIQQRGNLRNRVSFSLFSKTGDINNYDYAAFYNYDIHGNVDSLLQDYGATGIMAQNGGRYKRVTYQYDLISGKVNTVSYQPRLYDLVTKKYITQPDAFYHQYSYDAENRLTDVYTSADEIYWEHDAYYSYYKHGPLARTVLGNQQVQGLDYAYTLQGWLKGVNSTAVGTGQYDAGNDGLAGSPNHHVARDAFGFSLQYYNNDYTPITNSSNFAAINSAKPLYNGNISSMLVNIPRLGDARLYAYTYDQLNRITAMDAFSGLNSSNAFTPVALDDYKERISYDANGNILTYSRNGNKAGAQKEMDKLTYNYKNNANQLLRVRDAVPATNYTEDIDDQPANNYDYDAIGNLIKDAAEGITQITWTVYGKIESITKADGTIIIYKYDAAGNRINKAVTKAGTTNTTVYIRDARGNTLSVYEQNSALNSGHFTQSELHLYGSSRFGIYNLNKDLIITPPVVVNMGYGNSGTLSIFERRKKFFELSNHLGNVLATVSDEKIGVSINGNIIDYYTANVVSANDYYPFGMTMPGRSFVTPTPRGVYRYGFNGKENDKDITEGAQDYGMRINDNRLGRFLSVDPLTSKYPWYTPYQFAGNKPIWAVDLDGLEELPKTSVDIQKLTSENMMRILTEENVRAQIANDIYDKINSKIPSKQEMHSYTGRRYPGEKEIVMDVIRENIKIDLLNNYATVQNPDTQEPSLFYKVGKAAFTFAFEEAQPIGLQAGGLALNNAGLIVQEATENVERYKKDFYKKVFPKKYSAASKINTKANSSLSKFFKYTGKFLIGAGRVLERVGTAQLYYEVLNPSAGPMSDDKLREYTQRQLKQYINSQSSTSQSGGEKRD